MAKKNSKKSKLKFDKITIAGKISIFFFKGLIFFFALSIGSVVLFRFVPVYFTPLMFIRMYEQHKDGKEIKLERDWTPIENISPNMYRAVMGAEDSQFLEHNGFNTKAIAKAIEYNSKQKKKNSSKLRGGSTISQQTAKNVFTLCDRSFIRKGFETYFTFLIEFCWTKERIMEVYLNIVELGDGIYGVESAAKKYYHTTAKNLTKKQAASLAVCLPRPLKRNPNNLPSSLIRVRNRIISDIYYFEYRKITLRQENDKKE